MRVIARSTLNDFLRNRVARGRRAVVKAQSDAWYAEASKAAWNNSAELKERYRSASILSSERVVFNIKGNDYRLIVAINYEFQVVLIEWLGTQREYDEIDAREVEYGKRRHANSSDSD